MTKSEFIRKVQKIQLRKGCSISNAIDIAKTENRITNSEFIALFFQNKNGIETANNATEN